VAELKAIPADWRGDALRDGDGLVGAVRFIAGDSAPRGARCSGSGWQLTSGQPPSPWRRGHRESAPHAVVVDLTRLLERQST
jgi:hypothetical protein